MRKHSSETKKGALPERGASDVYPDISAIFAVDDNASADQPVEKAEVPLKGERILTAPDGIRHLPKAEQKKMKAEAKKARRARSRKKAKTRAIIVLSVLLAILIAALAIWLKIQDARKPVVAVSPAAVQTLEKKYSANGVILTVLPTLAVLIDNDYDVHALAKSQNATVVTADGTKLTGTVSEIRETRPTEERFAWLTSALLGSIPEVPVYTVGTEVEDPEGLLKEGDMVTVDIVTDTAENALAIPSSSVFMDGPQPYVWIFHPFTKKLSRQDISVGLVTEEKTEVLRGLKKGAKVLSGSSVPSAELYDGVRVKTK